MTRKLRQNQFNVQIDLLVHKGSAFYTENTDKSSTMLP